MDPVECIAILLQMHFRRNSQTIVSHLRKRWYGWAFPAPVDLYSQIDSNTFSPLWFCFSNDFLYNFFFDLPMSLPILLNHRMTANYLVGSRPDSMLASDDTETYFR
jgi:hypothetical protein